MNKRWLLPCLPCWVVGVLLSFLLPYAGSGYALAAGGLCAAGWWWWRKPWLMCVVALLLGVAYGLWRGELALAKQWPMQAQPQVITTSVTVATAAESAERSVRFQAQVLQPGNGGTRRLLLSDYQRRDWPIGSRWLVTLRVRPIVGEVNAVGFNREAWALANGLNGSATLGKQRRALAASFSWRWQHWRDRLGQHWQHQQAAYPLGTALMRALSIGDQAALPDFAWQAFRPLGLTHLVSVSGLHVGMLALLAGMLLQRLLRLWPRPVARPQHWVRLAVVLTAVFYSALSGFSVPTQRSLLMIIVLAGAWWHRSFLSSWQVWWLAMAVVLLWDPLAALSVGFWLSFLLVGALMYGSAGAVAWSKWRSLWQGQWAAGMASVVLVAYCFGNVPLASPFANVVAIPWFSWVLVPMALLGLFVPWTPLLTLTAATAEYTMQALLWLADYAPVYTPAQAPLLLWLLALLAVAVLLLPRGLYLRPWAWLILALLMLYCPPAPRDNEARVTVWDVGQGLAVGIQTAHHYLLFDTGTAYAAAMQLAPSLQATGVRQLDALVLSHHDADHDGGAALIRQTFTPQTVYAGQAEEYDAPTVLCQAGQSWQWDGVSFEFLNLPAPNGSKDNDRSCVLRAVAGGKAVLITGDLGKKGELALQTRYGDALFSQILLLGHHGSRSSSDARFIDAVSPMWAVASCGFGNAYHHPHPQVQTLLKAHQINLLRTDEMGGLTAMLSAEPIRWHRLRSLTPYWQRKPLKNAAMMDSDIEHIAN